MEEGKHIVLVTWLGGPNYGTVLQSYALHEALGRLGCKLVCLEKHGPLWPMRRLLAKEPADAKMRRVRAFQASTFVRKTTILGLGLKGLRRWADAFVCGSDQMWNTYNLFDPFFFLDCAGDVRRVAYAPSIGAKGFRPGTEDAVRKLLLRFDALSLREESGRELVETLTGRTDAVTVVDPTLLLSAEDWKAFAADAARDPLPEGPYVLCYILRKRDDYDKIVAEALERSGASYALVIPAMENPEISIEGAHVYPDAGPKEFVRLLSGAAEVLTDSFHGVAMSINLGVPYTPLRRFDDGDRESQNGRIDHLVDLQSSGRLDSLREFSWTYLKEALDVR